MFIFKTVQDLQRHIKGLLQNGKTVGFVPTMGALHQGHLSLIKQARNQCDCTVCSIFVNPTQFNDAQDLEKYPRTTAADIDLLIAAQTDILFLPSVEEVYPNESISNIHLDFGTLDKLMEGEHRPGHFAGVAQVVKRLLDIVKPHKLFMGQKDYQQFCICRSMIQQLNVPTQIVMCDIIREENGLAMSSRNMRLSETEKEIATNIYQVLQHTKANFDKHNIVQLKETAITELNKIPEFRLDYFEIADGETLLPATETSSSIIACTAVFVGEVRLIDNMVIRYSVFGIRDSADVQ
jgi:pantoate--beta-alanine ligase